MKKNRREMATTSKIEKSLLSYEKAKLWRRKKEELIASSNFFEILLEQEISQKLRIQSKEEIIVIKKDKKLIEKLGVTNKVFEIIENDINVAFEQLQKGEINFGNYFKEYKKRVNHEKWPKVFLQVDESKFEKSVQFLKEQGFILPPSPFKKDKSPEDAYRLFSLLLIQIPPEQQLLPVLAGIENVEFIYDAESLVSLPNPVVEDTSISPALYESVPMIFPPDAELPDNFPANLGEGIKVAVIDTGIDKNHPDLAGKVIDEISFVEDEPPTDFCGHGTHVAGTVCGTGAASGGKFKGIAPHATLLNVKVLNAKGIGRTEYILAGIRWAVENGADVINMSLGLYGNGNADGKSLLSLAVNKAVELGTFVAVAAGNEGPESNTIRIPADARDAATVGATRKDGTVANFSSRGPTDDPDETGLKPNFVAPGTNIVAPLSRDSDNTPLVDNPNYTVMSGTSMAAPHVAGAAAILTQYYRILGNLDRNPKLITAALTVTAKKLEGSSPYAQGAGLIQIPDAARFLYYMTVGKEEPEHVEKRNIIIAGRSKKDVEQLGLNGLMFIGTTLKNEKVLLDAMYPHVIFLCGKRGSGKSYTLGVIAEELAQSNLGIGVLMIDPIGIFWSLKLPNDQPNEIDSLRKLGIEPAGIENVSVYVPKSMFKDYYGTVDGTFSISASDLDADDWCLLFDLDRFGTQGLLIDRTLQLLRQGYTALIRKKEVNIPPTERYDIDDILKCISYSVELSSEGEGFAANTRRSVAARFKTVKNWGIFSAIGTPLSKLIKPGQITVIDVSHPELGETFLSLVSGILARKIYQARKKITRLREAGLAVEEEIPVTWLILDEAHILLPKNRETIATKPFVTYAKQGRKPGCALVLATQQPAATDDEVISQADIVIAHTLAFYDDIQALLKRVPTKVPHPLSEIDFIRKIPTGQAILADQKTQREAFLVNIRPRKSKHAGKEATPTAITRPSKGAPTPHRPAEPESSKGVVTERILGCLEREKRCLSVNEITNLTGLSEYEVRKSLNSLIDKGLVNKTYLGRKLKYFYADYVFYPELGICGPVLAVKQEIGLEKARKLALKKLEKTLFTFKEQIDDLSLFHYPIWRFRVEGIKNDFASKILGWLTSEDKEYVEFLYLDSLSDKLLVLSHDKLVFVDIPPGAPFEFEDLDEIAEFEEKMPGDIEVPYDILSEIKKYKKKLKALREMFPSTEIKSQRVCFLPIWKINVRHTEKRTTRIIYIDGIIGSQIEGLNIPT